MLYMSHCAHTDLNYWLNLEGNTRKTHTLPLNAHTLPLSNNCNTTTGKNQGLISSDFGGVIFITVICSMPPSFS